MLAQLPEAQLSADHLADQQLQHHLVDLELTDPLVNQVLEVFLVLASITPLDNQHFPSVELEAALAPHHSASVLLVDPEAPALPAGVELQAPVSVLEAQVHSQY